MILTLWLSVAMSYEQWHKDVVIGSKDDCEALIVITSEECKGCKELIHKLGKLDGLELELIIVDLEGSTAHKLIKPVNGSYTIPHVIYYQRIDGVWKRTDYVGTDVETVKRMCNGM